MSAPFFSIIIPTYNRAYVILKAINSIINQSFKDWELIVVDDGSSDNTKELIEKINNPEIKYVHQTNQERSAARNNGINHARGEYICFLDSDDEYFLDYLELLFNELNRLNCPKALIKSIPFIQFDNGLTKKFDGDFESNNNSIEHFLTSYSPLCAICCHSSILKEIQFDVTLKYAEDTNLWMRILSKYDLCNFKIHSCIIHISSMENIEQENIHLAYIDSFKKTFSLPEVKKNVSKEIIFSLIAKRLNWIRAEQRKKRKMLAFILTTIKLQLLKIGIN